MLEVQVADRLIDSGSDDRLHQQRHLHSAMAVFLKEGFVAPKSMPRTLAWSQTHISRLLRKDTASIFWSQKIMTITIESNSGLLFGCNTSWGPCVSRENPIFNNLLEPKYLRFQKFSQMTLRL